MLINKLNSQSIYHFLLSTAKVLHFFYSTKLSAKKNLKKSHWVDFHSFIHSISYLFIFSFCTIIIMYLRNTPLIQQLRAKSKVVKIFFFIQTIITTFAV